jgi:alcohol dehydrogenase class IV
MHTYPLLDLASAWHDAVFCLDAVEDLAAVLYAESDDTWTAMRKLVEQVKAVRGQLTLPEDITRAIAGEQADVDELADRAEAQQR